MKSTLIERYKESQKDSKKHLKTIQEHLDFLKRLARKHAKN